MCILSIMLLPEIHSGIVDCETKQSMCGRPSAIVHVEGCKAEEFQLASIRA